MKIIIKGQIENCCTNERCGELIIKKGNPYVDITIKHCQGEKTISFHLIEFNNLLNALK